MSERLKEESTPRRRIPRLNVVVWAYVVLPIPVVCFGLYSVFGPFGAHGETFPGTRNAACGSNLSDLWLGLSMYAGDHDDRYPEKDWMDATYGYRARGHSHTKSEDDKTLLFPGRQDQQSLPEEHCPTAPNDGYGYSMMSDLVGVESAIEGALTHPLVFDSVAMNRNSVGDLNLLPSPGRHEGFDNFVYASGRLKSVRTP